MLLVVFKVKKMDAIMLAFVPSKFLRLSAVIDSMYRYN
jgi:hypothetical protein